MGVRHFADYRTNETNEEITIEIHDSSFGGSSTKLFGTGSGWASRTLEQLDPREPLSSPIQKSEVSLSVWVKSSSLIDDVFSSEEGRFTLVYKKGATQICEVTVLQDLCSYQYLEDSALWKLTLKGKDFSILEGDSYGLQTDRVTIITALAEILPYGLNIKTRTSWIVDGLTAANDYLRQIYIDEFTLRTYARTGDETDEPFSKLQALEAILKANGLTLRQDGDWIIEQITALADPTSVLETVYNSSGVFQSASNVDLSTAVTVINQSPYNHNPGVKSARVKYDHRTSISGFQFPSQISTSGSEVLSTFFISNGTQTLTASGTVVAISAENETTATFKVQYKAGQYYWTGSAWSLTVTDVEYDMFGSGVQDGDGNYIYRGFLSEETTEIPADATAGLQITLNNAVIQGGVPTSAISTTYSGFSLVINNALELENSTFIDYQLTQSGNQSVRVDYGDTLFGDGPVAYARGAFRTSTSDADVTDGDWARRGEAVFTNHAQVLLREVIDVQRKSRARISATVKTALEFSEVVSWDGDYYYILGGEVDLFTGVSTLELLFIDVAVASDTFEVLPKFTADSATGSATTGGGSGGGGITQSFADARYLIKSLNLSDLTDVITARNNLDLGVLDDVEFNSLTLDLDANALVYSDAGGTLATTTNATLNASGHLDVARLEVDNIRIDGNTISTFSGNQSIILDPNGTGNTQVVGNFDVSGTIQGSVLISDVADGTAPLTVTSQTLVSNLNVELLGGYEADYFRAELVDLGLQADALFQQKVDKGREIDFSADNGLTGGGVIDLLENRVVNLALGTPSTTTVSSTNATTADSHTHALDLSGRTLTAGDGLTGLGDLGDDRTVDLGTPSTTTVSTTNATTADSHTHALDLSGRTLTLDNDADSVITFAINAQNLGADRTWTPAIADASGTQRGVVSLGAQSFEGAKTFLDNILLSDASKVESSAGFVSGFTGSGVRLQKDTTWELELDDMFIRGALFASEFIINQITALNGSDFLSPSVGKVEVISGSAPTEVLTMSDPQGNDLTGFVADDIVIIQQVNPQAFNGGGAIVKRIVREVDSVTDNVVTLKALTGAPSDTGSIGVGDIMVCIGNTDAINNPNRLAHIYRSVIDSGAPFVRINDEVDSWADFGDATKLKLQYGNLSGLTIDGVALEGYGIYTSNAYLTGSLLVGDLTKAGNYLEFDGTDLDVFANSISLTATGDISESFLDLQANIVELGLQADGAYSGIQFLAGQTIISASEIDAQGRAKIAEIRLDATGSETLVGISADKYLLNTTNLIIDSESELIKLGSTTQVQIGKQLALSASDDVGFRDDFNVYPSNVNLFGLYFDNNNYFTWVHDIDTTQPDGYAFRVGGATSNFLSVNAATGDAKINFDDFDLETSTINISSASTGIIALGTDASTSTVANDVVGFAVDGAGGFKAYGSATNYIRKSGTSLDIKASTFNLTSNGLSILSGADPEITVFDGSDKAVTVNTDAYTTEAYTTELSAEFVTMFDDGLPILVDETPLAIKWDGSLLTNDLPLNRYIRITKINFRLDTSTSNTRVAIRIDGKLTGEPDVDANYRTLVNSINAVDGQSVTTSFADYTLDNPVEFFTDPQFDLYRAVITIFPTTAQDGEFSTLNAVRVIPKSIINKTNVDVNKLRTRNGVEIIDAFDPSNKAFISFRKGYNGTTGVTTYYTELKTFVNNKLVKTTELDSYKV